MLIYIKILVGQSDLKYPFFYLAMARAPQQTVATQLATLVEKIRVRFFPVKLGRVI